MKGPEYAAVPLDEAANAPLDLLPEASRPPGAGPLPLRGLPFALGPEAGRCLVRLGDGGAGEVELTLGVTAAHLVFAHRLLDTRIPQGEAPGGAVAELVVTYEDGAQATHVVRERFEVAAVPTGWGQLPFLALPDEPDHLPADRWQGEYGWTGNRQAEVSEGWPRWFYLWAWRNPRPDVRMENLLLPSRGPRYVVGSVVAGLTAEFPFPRGGARALRVTIAGDPPGQRLDWQVAVDRGVAT